MDPDNFSQFICTPTASRRKLNRTYTKSQSRQSFSEQTSRKRKKVEDASNKLKNIGLTEFAWDTYQVNALYDFSYERIKLFEYEVILAKNVKKAILQSETDEFNSVEISIKFRKFTETAFSDRDEPAVKIEIISQDICEGSAEEGVEVLNGFLLSVERKEGLKEKERLKENAVILPLVLVQSVNKIFRQSFIDFLEENFSCIVSPLNFSSSDLKWMFTLLCSPDSGKVYHTAGLQYETPFEELKAIDYTIDAGSISRVWNKTIQLKSAVIIEDNVKEFISVLESHFYETFFINLSHLQLSAVCTPLAQVRTDPSSIRLYESNKLYCVLRHLTHLAQEVAD